MPFYTLQHISRIVWCLLISTPIVLFGWGCSTEKETGASKGPMIEIDADAININTASQEELRRIPFVGQRLAESIIHHRERYGPFRRPQHLLLINGISDKRFREIRHLIRTE